MLVFHMQLIAYSLQHMAHTNVGFLYATSYYLLASLMGDRLVVGHQVLVLSTGVRIPVPQPAIFLMKRSEV